MDLGSIETWIVKTAVKVVVKSDTPAGMAIVAAKSALQVAHNEGCLDPANRSKVPAIAEVQAVAAEVEDATDPYLHVDRNVIIDAIPGGQIAVKVGSFVLQRAPIPAVVRTTASQLVENVLEKIEGPASNGGGNSLAA